MKKFLNQKVISLFICLCLVICAVPFSAFAQNSSSGSQQTSSQSKTTEKKEDKDEKEVKKTEISLGSVYKKVYDGKEISKSDVYSLVSSKSGGVTVFTYEWYDANGKKIGYNPTEAGTYKLKIKVSEKDPSYTGSATVSYIIEQRPLEWDVENLKASKPFDGTAAAADVKGKLEISGVIDGDAVALEYDDIKAADFPTAEVQKVSVALTVENASLSGEDSANYSLPKLSPTVQASINKAYIKEITFPDNDNQYRLVVEETVYVTESLEKAQYNSEDVIKSALRAKVNETFADEEQSSAAFLTPVLQVMENGEWIDVTDENMPQENVNITLQYPEGTASDTHEFVIYKMKTSGDTAGEIEIWAHTEKVEGLETMLSQGDTLVIGYTAEKQTNMALIIIIGAVAVMIIAGAVFLKMHRADKEEIEETNSDTQ